MGLHPAVRARIGVLVLTVTVASGAWLPAPGLVVTSLRVQEPVVIEYVAHAAFVVQSPGGTRIAIDPYNGNIWLGYSFPDDVTADAVLVSHPHYDHDATYYFGNDTPVFRTPGAYRVGDVVARGFASEHYDRATFLDRGQEPLNTIWVIESGGLRIGHLGDNRPLDEADLEALGDVDVLLLNAAYFEAASADLLALLLETTTPRVLIPMHYRHHEIGELPRALRPVGDQLADHAAEYSESNVIELSAAALPAQQQIIVLKPSPAIEPWSESLHDAWIEANEGAGLLADAETDTDPARAEEALWEGLFHYEAAMDLAPHVLAFGHGAADALSRLNEVNDAIETLDHALARAPRADWTDRIRAHMLLGELYERGGRPDIAVEHYAYVAAQRHTHETALRERANARLAELR